MKTDLLGKRRWKVNFHLHTTDSDGRLAPDAALAAYRDAGYDAVAVTDHWHLHPRGEFNGMTVVSGVEYNTPGCDAVKGIYHILGLGMDSGPGETEINRRSTAQEIVDGIRAHGGLAVLAHPAWSLNTPEMILALRGVEATEIYNTISGVHMSRRADSSLIVDMLANRGLYLPLLADDDAHYLDTDGPVSYVMCEAEEPTQEALLASVREGRFYATQGPEAHIARDGDEIVVLTSPVREVVVHSNMGWAPRVFIGDGLTETRYKIYAADAWFRAEVTDIYGRKAWTNFLVR